MVGGEAHIGHFVVDKNGVAIESQLAEKIKIVARADVREPWRWR